MSESPTTVPYRRAVWTDFGGVLTPAMHQTWGAFCARLKVDPQVLMSAVSTVSSRYGTQDFMEPLDTPLVGEREWLAQIGAVLRAQGVVIDSPDSLGPIWFDRRETNHRWAERLRGARAAGHFVGVLSNMVPAWDEHWRRMLPVEAMFDDVVLSFEVGARKPDPAIFALAARRAGLPPGQCVLVDDLERNCAGALAAGWSAIQFRSADQAVIELDALLASPPVEAVQEVAV